MMKIANATYTAAAAAGLALCCSSVHGDFVEPSGELVLEAECASADGGPRLLIVELWMRNIVDTNVDAFQAFIEFDLTDLTYRGDLGSYTNDPFPLSNHFPMDIADAEQDPQGTPHPGLLEVAGFDEFNGPGTNLDSLLATLVFEVSASECGTTSLALVDVERPPFMLFTRLAIDGNAITTISIGLDNIGFDDTAPMITAPQDRTVNAPFGQNEADVDLGTPTASDNCTDPPFVDCSRDDNADCSDPFPCGDTIVTWSAIDACGNETSDTQMVTVICDGPCGLPDAGDCCVANGTPGCDDAACCNLVCAQDPNCCDTSWDQMCADSADALCGFCSPCGDPNAGDCCDPAGTGSPGCNDETCCDLVCAIDPLCCDTEWDGICAGEAADLCPPCMPPTGACCLSDGTCQDNTTQADCEAAGGVYQGDNTFCTGLEGLVVWGVDDVHSADSQLFVMTIDLDSCTADLELVGPEHDGADIEGSTWFGANVYGVSGGADDPHYLVDMNFRSGDLALVHELDLGPGTEVTGMATDGNGVHWAFLEDRGFATINADNTVTLVVKTGLPIEGVAAEIGTAGGIGTTLYGITEDARVYQTTGGSITLLADLGNHPDLHFDNDIENLELFAPGVLSFFAIYNDTLEFVRYDISSNTITTCFLAGIDVGDLESFVFAGTSGGCDTTVPCPGTGSCCESNGTPGCDDADCCNLVCAADAFCCNVTWDQMCADAAELACGDLCMVPCGDPVVTCDAEGDDDITQVPITEPLNLEIGPTGATQAQYATGPTGGPVVQAFSDPPQPPAALSGGSGLIQFLFVLEGGQLVPPADSAGMGVGLLTLNPVSWELTWNVPYALLSSSVIGAHLHAPAPAGSNADIHVDLSETVIDMLGAGTIIGSTFLEAQQVFDLIEGRWYLDLCTVVNPAGELRGQVLPVQVSGGECTVEVSWIVTSDCEIVSEVAVVHVNGETIPVTNGQEISIDCPDDVTSGGSAAFGGNIEIVGGSGAASDEGSSPPPPAESGVVLEVIVTDSQGNTGGCTLELCQFCDDD